MSFLKTSATIGFVALLGSAPLAYAQVGGGTELPNSAEPNSVKPGGGKAMKGGMMKKSGSMKKMTMPKKKMKQM